MGVVNRGSWRCWEEKSMMVCLVLGSLVWSLWKYFFWKVLGFIFLLVGF